MVRPRRCVVTGGAGFIGSHLVERLLADGHRVVVLDNYSTGNPAHLKPLLNSSGHRLSIHQIDVSNLKEIHPHFKEAEWVFHLAALADIVPSIQFPMAYHQANVDGTVCVLEAARSAGVKRFLYAASSSCYGIPDQYPTPESSPIRPMYPYALTKYLGEQYVLRWSEIYGLPAMALRLFNVYGPRSRSNGAYGAVFGVFLAQKLAGKPLTVVGNGSQTRDFIFVTDVVEAFIRAALSDLSGIALNVGSGKAQSINHLVELLEGDAVFVPKRPGEPDSTHADTRQIQQRLGWSPKVSFEEGVKIMVEGITQWRTAPVWDVDSIAEATREWFACLERKPHEGAR